VDTHAVQMVNYTRLGFAKRRVPEDIWLDVLKFWDEHKNEETVSPILACVPKHDTCSTTSDTLVRM
jgi:hypothetical protein